MANRLGLLAFLAVFALTAASCRTDGTIHWGDTPTQDLDVLLSVPYEASTPANEPECLAHRWADDGSQSYSTAQTGTEVWLNDPDIDFLYGSIGEVIIVQPPTIDMEAGRCIYELAFRDVPTDLQTYQAVTMGHYWERSGDSLRSKPLPWHLFIE